MKKLILLLTICTLISSCGLFRKTTKIDKSSVSVITSSDIQLSTDVKVDKVEKSTDNTITSSHSDEQLKIFPKPGTDIKIGPEGSMILQADSIIFNTKKKTNQARDLANQVTTNLQKTVDSTATEDSTTNQDNYNKDVIKEPSAQGIFGIWIGWKVGLFIIIIGLYWYLKRK